MGIFCKLAIILIIGLISICDGDLMTTPHYGTDDPNDDADYNMPTPYYGTDDPTNDTDYNMQGNTDFTTEPITIMENERLIESPCNGSSSWPPMLFDEESEKCFEMGRKGPCGNNLRFFPKKYPATNLGHCDCPQGTDVQDIKIPFPNVYHKATEQCYQTYTQAFCKEGHWLIFTNNSAVQCVPNPCAQSVQNSSSETGQNIVFVDGHCLALWSSCGQSKNEDDEMMMSVDFHNGSKIPSCEAILGFGAQGAFASGKLAGATFKCGKGQVGDEAGDCHDLVELD